MLVISLYLKFFGANKNLKISFFLTKLSTTLIDIKNNKKSTLNSVKLFSIIDLTEKKINSWINLWIRCPGCTSHAVLTLLVYNIYNKTLLSSDFERFGYIFTAAITYWNGIYFMNKVIISYNNSMMNFRIPPQEKRME